jgi:hypothetical protein
VEYQEATLKHRHTETAAENPVPNDPLVGAGRDFNYDLASCLNPHGAPVAAKEVSGAIVCPGAPIAVAHPRGQFDGRSPDYKVGQRSSRRQLRKA